jgi:hypothetical protein
VCAFCSTVNIQKPTQYPHDVIVFIVTGITALPCWYRLSALPARLFSTDAVPHLSLKLNIINGVRSGHLNGQEDHSPPRRISVQDFTNIAKEMHHLIGKFGQNLLKF